MVKRSRVGDNVSIPIPMVDRGRGDPRNILGVILDCDEHNMYTIAVKSGIISSKYARKQFDLCPQNNVKPTNANALRLVKCVTSDATTVSSVRISRTMYVT